MVYLCRSSTFEFHAALSACDKRRINKIALVDVIQQKQEQFEDTQKVISSRKS